MLLALLVPVPIMLRKIPALLEYYRQMSWCGSWFFFSSFYKLERYQSAFRTPSNKPLVPLHPHQQIEDHHLQTPAVLQNPGQEPPNLSEEADITAEEQQHHIALVENHRVESPPLL